MAARGSPVKTSDVHAEGCLSALVLPGTHDPKEVLRGMTIFMGGNRGRRRESLQRVKGGAGASEGNGVASADGDS